MFLVTTTLVAVFKRETEPHDPEHEVVIERDVKTAYSSLLQILKLTPMKTLVILLLTCKVGRGLLELFKRMLYIRSYVTYFDDVMLCAFDKTLVYYSVNE